MDQGDAVWVFFRGLTWMVAMYQGWFKLWRKAMRSKVFANADIWKLWTLCMAKANWGDDVILWEGSSKPIEVKRGQFVTGRDSLHRDYYAVTTGNRKSARTIWRWLHVLESWHCLRLENVQKYTLVTLLKYGPYQDQDADGVQEDVQVSVQVVSRSCPDDVQVVSTREESLEAKEPKEDKEDTWCLQNGDTPADVFDAWNATEGTAKIVDRTPARVQQATGRLSRGQWKWRDALKRFPLGFKGTNGDWVPTIDLFLEPNTVTRILEGAYDNPAGGSGAKAYEPLPHGTIYGEINQAREAERLAAEKEGEK